MMATPEEMPEKIPNKKPGFIYHLGRMLQLIALVGLGIVALLFPYWDSVLHLLFFTIEGVALFIVGWLMTRHRLAKRSD